MPDAQAKAYLETVRDAKVALFGTLGAWPDSDHARDCIAQGEALVNAPERRNKVLGTYLCQGKVCLLYTSLRIRGWRMTPWNAFRHPVLLIRLVFTPLLFRSLKTSEELGIAAELKGLGYGEGMRPYRKLVWKASDTWLLVAACLVAAAAVLCQHAVGWAPLEGGMR